MKSWMWVALGAALVAAVGLSAWLAGGPETGAGAAAGSAGVLAEVARRKLALAAKRREEADAHDAEPAFVDDGPSAAERFARGE